MAGKNASLFSTIIPDSIQNIKPSQQITILPYKKPASSETGFQLLLFPKSELGNSLLIQLKIGRLEILEELLALPNHLH